MRYLVLSDVHSNWEALAAVLENARGEYDRIVSCGDLAGYGPDPNRIAEWARANLYAGIRGNHDRACTGQEDLEWFNDVAKAASIWTMSHLTETNLEYLRNLPAGPLTVGGFQLIHGSPLDEDEYLVSIEDARNVFSYLEANVTFFGHTHLQCAFIWRHGKYYSVGRPEASESGAGLYLDPDGAYLINPGSVGQPRDNDPRAAYAIFDTDTREVIQRRTDYDYEATRRKIERAGLPEVLGYRLLVGR